MNNEQTTTRCIRICASTIGSAATNTISNGQVTLKASRGGVIYTRLYEIYQTLSTARALRYSNSAGTYRLVTRLLTENKTSSPVLALDLELCGDS